MELLKSHRSFGGTQYVYAHASAAIGASMELSVYVPPQAEAGPVPALIWLSGLTCTWANATEKAGLQRAAAEHGVIIVCPDTSPRDAGIPGETLEDDLGAGASFYVDATEAPWNRAYHMYSYVTEDIPSLITTHLPADIRRLGIFGHSMGGHGALVAAFRNPELFGSVSAFAPISAPARGRWGQKALTAYLGTNRATWEPYDASLLAAQGGWEGPVLVDQGTEDPFLASDLMPDQLEKGCASGGIDLTLRMQEGYDHSYYFVASFMDDHVAHHARELAKRDV